MMLYGNKYTAYGLGLFRNRIVKQQRSCAMERFVLILVLTVASIVVIRWSWTKTRPTIESFLVADRRIPFSLGVATLTANWVQAPAILASGMFAYQSPYHFLAFIMPNVAALVLMGLLAPGIQRAMPYGYTVAQFMGQVFGPGVRTLFFLSSFGALSLAVAYTFTGLRQWFGQQLGMGAPEVAIVIGIFACLWVIPRGLPGAIVGDVVKITLAAAGMIGTMTLVMNSHLPPAAALFVSESVSPIWVFWSLGIPLAASLIGGPICNPDLGERTYAVDARIVQRAYFSAAALFGLAVTVFGSLGILARHLHMQLTVGQLPAFAVLQASVPAWVTIAVTIGLVIVFATALASLLASSGDLVVVELYRRFIRPNASEHETIRWGRAFMLVPILVGTYLASLEKVDLSLLLQSMAIVRGEAIIPVILAVFLPKQGLGNFMFWGMLVAAIGGSTLTFYQPTLFLALHGKPLGALFAVTVPLIFWAGALYARRFKVSAMA